MTGHLSNEQIRAYRERTLAVAELLDVSQHLGGCEACRARMAPREEVSLRFQAFQQALRSDAGPRHLTYEQIEEYVDGTMGAPDRVSVESHARDCRLCAADVEGIRALKQELESAHRISRRDNRRAFWNWLLGWRGGFVLAAAACAVILVMALRTPAGQKQNLAVVTQGPPNGSGNSARAAQNGSVIRDGSRVFTVGDDGRIEGLAMVAEADRAVLEKALVEKRVEAAAPLSDLTSRSGVLLGSPTEPAGGKLLAPLATVVENPRPVFRWEPISGARYRVSIYDSGYNLVASSDSVSGTEWQAPKPLRRGARYSWQLNVHQNNSEYTLPTPPAPEARFRVLSAAQEASLVQARSVSGDSRLVLGILYAHAGLLDQAEEELRALEGQNPTSKEVADLLASVEQLRSAPR
jgi:anti-sigma factor RsiW